MWLMAHIFYNASGQKIKVPSIVTRTILKTVGVPHLGSRIRLILLKKGLEKLPVKNFKKALDGGCGYGLASVPLSQKGIQVEAIDIDKKRLEVARNLFRNNQLVAFSRASLYKLPFKDKNFDLCVCLEVLEHLKKDTTALKELSRVTTKNGVLIVSFPEHSSDKHGSKEMGHVRNGYEINEFLKKASQVNYQLLLKSSYGKSFLGKTAFRIDYALCKLSPLLSCLAFPFLYPILILDQLLDSPDLPSGYLLVLKKLTPPNN